MKLGILGLGNRSTLFYINKLNESYNHVFGGYSTCPFVLVNEDFNRFNPFLPNQFEVLEKELTLSLSKVNELDIDTLLIPNITLHETFDRLGSSASIYHPVELLIKKLKTDNQNEVIITGSKYTMESNYICDLLRHKGVKVVRPTIEQKSLIDDLRQKIYNNEETEESLKGFQNFINEAQLPVVFACTELSVVSNNVTGNIYDMATLQIDSIINDFKG